MINSVSVSRGKADFSQRVARSNTPASVLTDAVKSFHPAQGEHLFQQIGDESREQFLSSVDNAPDGDVADNAQLAKLLQARFAKVATTPKRFHSLMKQALGEKYDANTVDALLQQSNDGDFSWLSEFTSGAQGEMFIQLFANENAFDENNDADLFTAQQNEPDSAWDVATDQKRNIAASLLKRLFKQGANAGADTLNRLGNTIDETIAQPFENGVERLGSWSNDNIRQPIEHAAQSFGRWAGEKIALPFKNGFENLKQWGNEKIKQPIQNKIENFKSWSSENIAQPVRQNAQKLGGWIGENITQPGKYAAKQIKAWINENVMQPTSKVGNAAINGTKSLLNKFVAEPVQPASKVVQ